MKQLLILSGKGGTGKTTVAAAFISLSGARAYADCDIDAPNLHLIRKNEDEPERSDFFALPKAVINVDKCLSCGLCLQTCRFGAVVQKGNKYVVDTFSCEGCGICARVCPADAIHMHQTASGELMLYTKGDVFSTAKLRMGSGSSGKLVSEVKKRLWNAAPDTDISIVDGSPGIGCPVIASMSGADMVLIVAEPSVSGISDMQRIIKTAGIFGTKAAVCVNKYDINLENTVLIEKYCTDNAISYAGRIPFDKAVVKAVNNGISLDKIQCSAADAVRQIYKNTLHLLNNQVVVVDDS